MDELRNTLEGAADEAMEATEGPECQTDEIEGLQAQGSQTEGGQGEAAGEEEQARVSVGMAAIPMRLIQELAERHASRQPALSREDEAKRLLAAYADYARPNVFTPGQLVVPKALGRDMEAGSPFGVVLDADAVPGSQDAPHETLRIGRFLDGMFRTDVYDPLRFQPYVQQATETDPAGGEAGA